MFQYDFTGSGPGVPPIIKDFGRTESQIVDFFQQSGRELAFAWSLDGVRVAVDDRNKDAVHTMATKGDALTDNTVLAADVVGQQVTAQVFNSLRAGGYFEWPGLADWKVGAAKRLAADTPSLNIAVLSVPTHIFKAWGAVSTANRLTVLNQALRIAFDTWMGDYRADSVYVFAAPEYYFGGTDSHFLADDDATAVTRALSGRLQLLPDNYVVIPGSVGRRRPLTGHAAYDYYLRHADHHTALLTEMADHKLSEREVQAQQWLWKYEPTMTKDDTKQTAYVYSNTATVFRGRTAPETHTKRYESDADGGSPDRNKAQNEDGYFDIGTGPFTTVIKGLTVRLEICSDNSYESIKDSPYNGLHVLLASDFGQVEPETLHGQVYAHVDSTHASVTAQPGLSVAPSRTAAAEREFSEVEPQQTAGCAASTAKCQLTLHQLKLPTA